MFYVCQDILPYVTSPLTAIKLQRGEKLMGRFVNFERSDGFVKATSNSWRKGAKFSTFLLVRVINPSGAPYNQPSADTLCAPLLSPPPTSQWARHSSITICRARPHDKGLLHHHSEIINLGNGYLAG